MTDHANNETGDQNSPSRLCYTAEELREAYAEGFGDGADRNNLPYKYPPLCIAWIESQTRLRIQGPSTEDENRLANRFYDSKADMCEQEQYWQDEVDKLSV